MSLEDLIDSEQPAHPADATEGTRRGTVIAIHKDDIFVEFGGKSQGLLPAEQFRDEPLPQVGDVIEVTIEGYDRSDGLLLLARPAPPSRRTGTRRRSARPSRPA